MFFTIISNWKYKSTLYESTHFNSMKLKFNFAVHFQKAFSFKKNCTFVCSSLIQCYCLNAGILIYFSPMMFSYFLFCLFASIAGFCMNLWIGFSCKLLAWLGENYKKEQIYFGKNLKLLDPVDSSKKWSYTEVRWNIGTSQFDWLISVE